MTFEKWEKDAKEIYDYPMVHPRPFMDIIPDWKAERTKFIEGLKEIADNLDTPIAIAKIARRLLEKKSIPV